jgi:murein DD-endopeptidase MepM/ murein hydrolase activator NlpD
MRLPLKYIYITQGYGFTDNPDTKSWYKNGFHYGLDFRAPTGTIIYAPISGVTKIYTTDAGGLSMEIINGNEKVFICHLSERIASGDVMVRAGQPIAYSGNSGKYTTGSHLHLSYLINGEHQNPALLFDALYDGTKINSKDFEKSCAYHRYGKKQNWLAEFNVKFKNPWLHKKMKERYGYVIPNTETANALVYGGWAWEEVANPAMYQTWSRQTKY